LAAASRSRELMAPPWYSGSANCSATELPVTLLPVALSCEAFCEV
jgi:hypothetical protein